MIHKILIKNMKSYYIYFLVLNKSILKKVEMLVEVLCNNQPLIEYF